MDALRAKVIDYFNEMAHVKWKTPGQVIDFTVVECSLAKCDYIH